MQKQKKSKRSARKLNKFLKFIVLILVLIIICNSIFIGYLYFKLNKQQKEIDDVAAISMFLLYNNKDYQNNLREDTNSIPIYDRNLAQVL